MGNFYHILRFLNEYGGKKHDPNNEKETASGQLAYINAKLLGLNISLTLLESDLDFKFIGTSKWQNSGNNMEYFWLQFKRPEHEDSPFSISVSNVNIGGKYHFKVYLEIADKEYVEAENKLQLRQMFCRSITDVVQPECDFYYEGVTGFPYKYKRLGNKVETASINLAKYYKITTNITVVVDEEDDDAVILKKLIKAFNHLVPAYDAIFGEGPKYESWVLPCNCEKYDVISAFEKFEEIDWHSTLQTKNIARGDTVYIYVGKPYSRLMYKCEVTKTGLPNREIDDSEFVKVPQELWEGEGFRIRWLYQLLPQNMSLENLNEHGVNGRIQGARKLESEALEYIENNAKPLIVINNEEKEQLSSLTERELEAVLEQEDDASCYVFKEAIVKVRKINKEIIDKLKAHYGGECQLCGAKAGADFGKEIVEAHHIEYFSKTQNNDSSNIIIVCPNCHRLIHSCNPVYNKKDMSFDFDGGKKLRLINPGHLKSYI